MIASHQLKVLVKVIGIAILGPLLVWGGVLIALRFRSFSVRTYSGEPAYLGNHDYFPSVFTTAELVFGYGAVFFLIAWFLLRRSFRNRVNARSYAVMMALGVDLFLVGCSVAALPYVRHPDSGRALVERSESIYYSSEGPGPGFHHYEAYRPLGDLFASSLALGLGSVIAAAGIMLMLIRSGVRISLDSTSTETRHRQHLG